MFDVFGLRGFSRYLETRVRVLHMLQRIVGTQLLDGAPRELRSTAVACFIRDMRRAQSLVITNFRTVRALESSRES